MGWGTLPTYLYTVLKLLNNRDMLLHYSVSRVLYLEHHGLVAADQFPASTVDHLHDVVAQIAFVNFQSLRHDYTPFEGALARPGFWFWFLVLVPDSEFRN